MTLCLYPMDSALMKRYTSSFSFFKNTSRTQQQMLDQYLFELLDLSDYFQVEILKSITMERVKKGLSVATAEAYLNRIRTHNEPELITMLIDFVTFNYPQLARNEFPFHKLGKKMLLEVLRRIRNPGHFNETKISSERDLLLGNPAEHEAYTLFNEGRFHDYKLQFNDQEYPVHKCILMSESPFFQKYLADPEMNKTAVYVVNPKHHISQEGFNVFLLVLYTNTITTEDRDKYYFQLLHLSVEYEVKAHCLIEIKLE
jgi:hypothetical protein